MSRTFILTMMLLAAGSAAAQDASPQHSAKQHKSVAKPAQIAKATPAATPAPTDEAKTLAGISILGNQEAPKSLVIVPWKSSQIGDMPGLSRLLDDSVHPLDKDVFMRELAYYQIRSSH